MTDGSAALGTSTQPSLIAISGSPSPKSKTARLAEFVPKEVAGNDGARHFRVSSVLPAALLKGDLHDPVLAEMVDAVATANGVIIATPIFKASYSGLLKAFLDVLPQFAPAGCAVMPVATGGTRDATSPPSDHGDASCVPRPHKRRR